MVTRGKVKKHDELTPKQREIFRELEQIASLLRLDYGQIKEYEREERTPRLKDLGAHMILEVIPNTFTGQKTDPRAAYVLRWIAGRRAGIPEFDPPYVIV